jgi:FHS family L-fucose permease-like MFS transporter
MTSTAKSSLMPMSIIGGMFFIFGFVTWLNGPLITFVKLAFTLDDVSAFLVPMAFYMSYFFLSLPAAAILRRTGMKKGMALALLVMAGGAALFGQFVDMRLFPGALTALFIIGAGLSILQTASNPYISILGPIDSAAQRIAFMGICNKLAGALAPLAFAAVVMSGVDGLADQVAAASPSAREVLLSAFAHKVYLPYMAMAGLLAVLALGVLLSPLPEVTDKANADDTPSRSLFSHANLWLGFICLFLYVGVEVMAGDAIGTYGRAFGLPLDQTKYFTTGTLVAMLAGYIVGLMVIPRFVSQARYLAFSAVLGVIFTVAAYLTRGYASVACVALLGFANAMMWPAIFPLGIKGLGRHTETGSAILVMGIAGGAIIPQLFAVLKETYNFQLVFAALMVPSYLYILFFGLFAARRGAHRQG